MMVNIDISHFINFFNGFEWVYKNMMNIQYIYTVLGCRGLTYKMYMEMAIWSLKTKKVITVAVFLINSGLHACDLNKCEYLGT